MEANDVAIQVCNVSHQFGEEGSTQFVRAMLETSLDIHRGELLCLIGPSGCGKSTLLNVIGGLLTPTSGQVLVSDQEVRGPLPQEIAYVFQENALFPWSTVIENVNLGMMFQGVPKAAREPRARKSLAAVGLSDFANHYPGQLSGGMRQRAALARALSLETGIILMDEPFGALDAQTRSEMQQLLLKVWDETASTILFVTHDVDEAVYLADRIFVMSAHPGTIIEDVQVPFDRPRDLGLKERNEFHELANYVLGRLRKAPGNGQVRVSV